MGQLRAAPLWQSGLRCRCPRCGRGKLFAAYLKIAPACTVCGLDYSFADAGDGPAVFVILIAGAFIVACALFVEVNYRPPYWLHAVLWLPLTLTMCLGMLPLFKATLFALQYRNQSGEGRLDK
jgi:uncharacterized protein (DUF983 family)